MNNQYDDRENRDQEQKIKGTYLPWQRVRSKEVKIMYENMTEAHCQTYGKTIWIGYGLINKTAAERFWVTIHRPGPCILDPNSGIYGELISGNTLWH